MQPLTGATTSAIRLVLVLGAALPGPVRGSDASAASVPRSIGDYGAVPDGRTVNTAAIQRAIDEISAAGGGSLRIPPGRWVTGGLVLRDGVALVLEDGAVLLGSTSLEDYPPHAPAYRSYSDTYVRHALIYAEKAQDIALVGRGTIDGQGGHPAFARAPDSDDPAYLRRPYLIRFVSCRKVRVEGLTLRDPPMWTQHYLDCDDVVLRDLTVEGHCNLNNDMLDIDGCRNVRVTGCTGDTGDDAITLKSTGPRPCEGVTISDCVVSSHCNGLKLGTETTGGFRHIAATNVVIRPSRFPVRFYGHPRGSGGIALQMVDGGMLEDVVISNVAIEGTESPIFIRLGNRARPHVSDAPPPGMGRMRNVVISNVIATGASRLGSAITGLPGHSIENLTLRDILISTRGGGTAADAGRRIPEKPAGYPECTMFGTLPAAGLYIRHVAGLTMDNLRVVTEEPDARPGLILEDVRDLVARGLAVGAPPAGEPLVLRDVEGAWISGCVAPPGCGAFLRLTGRIAGIGLVGNDFSRASTAWTGAIDAAAVFEEANRPPDRR